MHPDDQEADSGHLPDAQAEDAGGCTTNESCGENAICRKDSGECVSLLSEDCVRVVGDASSDRAVIIGSVLKIVGQDLGGSPSMQAGMELARDEIMEVARGLPDRSGGKARPLVLVECNAVVDAVRATRYLTETIGVPAVLGASNSGTTTAMATEVTIPGKVLLMSPTATSPTISSLDDDGLVWRASPSDTFQGKVMSQVYAMVQARVASEDPSAAGKVRLALLTKGDTYGKGLRDVLLSTLEVNGKPVANETMNFRLKEYPNTDDEPSFDFTPIISDVSAFAPHVVMIAGTGEALKIIRDLEALLGPTDPKPLYLLSDGMVNPDLPALVDMLDGDAAEGLRARTLGVIPGNPGSRNFTNFRLRFSGKFGSTLDPTNGSFGYDSLYLTAYAIVASQTSPPTGPDLAEALKKITGANGVKVTFEPNSINDAMQLLTAGQTIDVTGASGPLDFDPRTGDPIADIDVQTMCVSDGQTAWVSSGLAYDAVGDALVGAVKACP